MDMQSVKKDTILQHVWTPVINEELTVSPVENNIHDHYAIVMMKDDQIVG